MSFFSKTKVVISHRASIMEASVMFVLFKRLLQTRGPYKITSNIKKKKHCVNTINITEK